MAFEEKMWEYYQLMKFDEPLSATELIKKYEAEYHLEENTASISDAIISCRQLFQQGYTNRKSMKGRNFYTKKPGGRRFPKPSSLEKTESDFGFGSGLCPA
ncbi:hypothetical protein HN604_03405 [archaeon]|jgi:hypothetical protein|nr:hypothetical protein [archaeon]MBT6182369.1 hypothetical protein [archaeon]MBT6606596.1 hypothetical protein [archaeon]MBT7251839.1 hypothetical protein [archaeon]MBT7661101.1 hypothetical protein [archaeon]